MDAAALWINAGIFIATAAAAAVAWVQAIIAGRSRDEAQRAEKEAQKARAQAASALTQSAEALREANRIAQAARDLLQGQDAREREQHYVEWKPVWNYVEGRWMLSNEGPDTAEYVRLTVTSDTIGRVTQEVDEVPPQRALGVELPAYKGAGGMPRVEWHVEWRTPLGTPRSEDGGWPTLR
ncbi:hypothetical protein [uncultured Microbacterium sp.]|uniref:hypothetical protein n=1 Tax=uncultured Microbacterium sp. TaxID=191216 RepID=UPI0025E0D724|nr:hypothetical protein [uncultured Microbacterium sp.]